MGCRDPFSLYKADLGVPDPQFGVQNLGIWVPKWVQNGRFWGPEPPDFMTFVMHIMTFDMSNVRSRVSDLQIWGPRSQI